MEEKPKQAFLLLTTSDSEAVVTRVHNLARFAPCHVAYESLCDLSFPHDVLPWKFSLSEMPFQTIGKRVVPGSTIFAAMTFLLDSDYDSIWFIEEDAFIKGGNWQELLDLGELEYDFIGVNITEARENWMWTKHFKSPDGMNVEDMWHLKSLCCICHISRAAAFVVTAMLRLGFTGHHEMLVPTLVQHCGLNMADLTTLGMVDHRYFQHHPALTPDEIKQAPSGFLLHPCKDSGDGKRVGDGMISNDHSLGVTEIEEDEPDEVTRIFATIGGRPFGCSHAEYHFLGLLIRGWAPVRFLVFGVGRDTEAWTKVNSHGGRTLFLEDDPQWLKRTRESLPNADIRQIKYSLPHQDWVRQGHLLNDQLIPVVKGAEIEKEWDVIFVDGPKGGMTGRQQSAYFATQLLRTGGLLAIHDCDRKQEQEICARIIEASYFRLLGQVERLRIYKKGPATNTGDQENEQV